MTYIARYMSPLGAMTLASDGTALTGLWFDGQKHCAAPAGTELGLEELPVFRKTKRWLDAYFAGLSPAEEPPLRFVGTPFQCEVWALLREIPYGGTVSYGALAARLSERTGRRTSARAVGGAVGRNPISLIVPCHRVVGADGSLVGYAGGVERKRRLLEREREGNKGN